MSSKRVVLGMLAGTLLLASAAGPAGATALGSDAGAAGARSAAASVLAEHLPSGPGSFTAAAGQEAQRRSVTQILTSVRGHRDLDAWLGAVAEVIKTTSGADVATASGSAAEHEDNDDLPYSGAFAETYDAGDLDGDGRSDVVTYHWDVQTWQPVLEARRGDTGAVLWERSAGADGGLAWPLGEDLTGNGTADLLIYDLEILTDSWEDCDWDTDDCWEQPWEATFRWTVGLVDGSAAEAVWSRSLDGWIRESYEVSGESPAPLLHDDQFSFALDGVNLGVIPFVGDLGGDGLPDVILNEIDLTLRVEGRDTYAWTPVGGGGTWEGDYSLESTTRASVTSATGDATPVMAEGGTGRIALVWPLTHPDGSTDVVRERWLEPSSHWECAYADVVVTGAQLCPVDEQDGQHGFELALLDGRSFAEQWSTTIHGWGMAWPLGGDLDADGRGDIGTWRVDVETWQDDAQPLSGATGAALWDDVSMRDILTVGPLNDAPGDDVIAIDYDESYSQVDGSSSFTLYLQRRDGSTGELFAETVHTVEDGPTDDGFAWSWLYVTSGEDANGDGMLDLTVGTVTEVVHDDGEEWSMEYGGSRAVAESGPTGEPLYIVESAEALFLFLADDFDGDGLTEAVEETVTAQGEEWDEWTVTFTPRRLTDGTALWRDEATGSYVFHTWGGDADGNGSGEVYRHVDSMDAQRRFSTVVTALDGATGTGRWSLQSR